MNMTFLSHTFRMVNTREKSTGKGNYGFLKNDRYSNENKRKIIPQRKPKQQERLKRKNSDSQVQKRKKGKEEFRKQRETTREDASAHAAAERKDRPRKLRKKTESKAKGVSVMSEKQKFLERREHNKEPAKRFRDKKKEASLVSQ